MTRGVGAVEDGVLLGPVGAMPDPGWGRRVLEGYGPWPLDSTRRHKPLLKSSCDIESSDMLI